MPAPQAFVRPHDVRPALGHVNLMVDTFLANASLEDLRAIMRSLLATESPSFAANFASTARARLLQTNAKANPNPYTLFIRQTRDRSALPAPQLNEHLSRARSLYGAGMGFASLGILAVIVRATVGLRWEPEGAMADALAVIDADIGQAIQSSKEEIEGGRVADFMSAREAVNDLRMAVNDSQTDTKAWGGEFPFERAASSIEFWKI